MSDSTKKPLGRKCYGSIAHLPNSRMGEADRAVHEGQARIATEKARDKHDVVIVQEKLDGSNVAVAMKDGKLHALVRAGYTADSSPHIQHKGFSEFVTANEYRFKRMLGEGERASGEWLAIAHGTRYDLHHEPFVPFDIFTADNVRVNNSEFTKRTEPLGFEIPFVVHSGSPISVEDAFNLLGDYGRHGALDYVEGLIYRVERKGVVDFLCKYVRPDHDGNAFYGQDLLNRWRT